MTEAGSAQSVAETRLVHADRRILEFLAAWRAARRKTLVPFRSDFDPMQIPGLLPHVWLYRFDPEIGDYVCKLAGEEVNLAWGRSIKGATLREIVGSVDHSVMTARWHKLRTVPLLHYGSASERLSELETQTAERLLAPLASDSDTIDHVLGISLYTLIGINPALSALVPAETVQIRCADL